MKQWGIAQIVLGIIVGGWGIPFWLLSRSLPMCNRVAFISCTLLVGIFFVVVGIYRLSHPERK